ncbi:unnamed protein product [Arctogadus glacialis]
MLLRSRWRTWRRRLDSWWTCPSSQRAPDGGLGGSARMTLEPRVVDGGTVRGTAVYGLSSFPAPPPHAGRHAYRFTVGKVNPTSAFSKEGAARAGGGGRAGGQGVYPGGGRGLRLPSGARRRPGCRRTRAAHRAAISLLQPPATSPAPADPLGAWPVRTPGGGSTGGAGDSDDWGGDTPLSSCPSTTMSWSAR